MKLLIVDDYPPARRHLIQCLAGLDGVDIHEAGTLTTARQVLTRHAIDVALIDLRLDDAEPTNRDGLTLVRELRDGTSTVPVVVTVSSAMAEIRNAMRLGAYAYILKDELCEELVVPVLTEIRSRRALEREVLQLHGLVGASAAMDRLQRTIKKVTAVDSPVLICGPTGSGKELVARAIHKLSSRRAYPQVTVNCATFTESLVESQLFGHEKGYFTGADKAREGYLSEVRQGTLFLDEIAELPLNLQTKLLRVLENRVFRVLGAAADSHFAGRVIAATHVDLPARVQEGRFREDLYYRLEVLSVRVPMLDERKEDIPLLVEHFAHEAARRVQFAPDALAALQERSWPGNVRQLRNLVHRLAVFGESETITAADLELTGTPHAAAELSSKAGSDIATVLLSGISARQPRKQNAMRIVLNQIRVLEMQGESPETICRILGVGRATFFRIKAGQDV